MQAFEEYITVGSKRLRCGYTTGTCAAAAARAAAELLCRGEEIPVVVIETPAGIAVPIDVEEHACGRTWARCAVRKDAGDDPDVTDGVLVYAQVEWCNKPGIHIEGGAGVGRVTREGLDQPVGAAAINSVPRQMIRGQIERVLASRSDAAGSGDALPDDGGSGVPLHPGQGILVTISVPGGEEIARKTFNPRLGITGGISIIGTSGIVKPMSEEAIVASIELELKMLRANGARDLLVVPGNYGRDFAGSELALRADEAVQCSNYFGATLDAACLLGFESVLIVGHLGKMVKVAGGIMNTHSRVADCRLEILAAHAALAGASQTTIRQVMAAATTDAALDVLLADGVAKHTMDSLMRALAEKLANRVAERMQVEAIVFSNKRGLLGQTPGAAELSSRWRVSSGV